MQNTDIQNNAESSSEDETVPKGNEEFQVADWNDNLLQHIDAVIEKVLTANKPAVIIYLPGSFGNITEKIVNNASVYLVSEKSKAKQVNTK